MELFIGNLPPNTHISEVIAFFKGFSHKATFRMEQKKQEDGSAIRYVVADFENDKYAVKFIEKYAGQRLRDHELQIHEYVHRSYTNERRAVNWREKPWRAGERRRTDRRQKEHLEKRDEFEEILTSSKDKEKQKREEEAATLKVEAYKDFARKN